MAIDFSLKKKTLQQGNYFNEIINTAFGPKKYNRKKTYIMICLFSASVQNG